jgi:NADPH2:quinone reductase
LAAVFGYVGGGTGESVVKVIRADRPGGPEVLHLEDIELPAPGPGEAQVRHHAIGVNYIDVYRRTGAYPAELPFVPGHEGAGEVIAVGEGVEEFQPGDRVAYVGALGGYSESRNIAAAALVHLPKSFSYATGAVMMLKGLTAQYLLRRTFRVKNAIACSCMRAPGGSANFFANGRAPSARK